MNKNLILILFAASILQACGGAQSNSVVKKDDTNKKILSHCTMMRNYGMWYAKLRSMGYETERARKETADTIQQQYQLPPSKRFNTITAVYASFIELQETHSPNTTGYFVLAQCLATHSSRKTLPNESEEGRKKIDTVLASCERNEKSEDALGACILNGLRPLTKPIGS